MISQSVSKSRFGLVPPPHMHVDAENCPACGQEIPSDRLEEISGKIAAREREQALALTTRLEQQHALDRSQVEAKAKADLDSERQLSILRERAARDEARQAAETAAAEALAAAAEQRKQAEAVLNQQLEASEASRRNAELQKSELNGQLAASAAALETEKAAAKSREDKARQEERQAADAASAIRIAALEEAQRQREDGLQAQLVEANASKTAADQKTLLLENQIKNADSAHQAQLQKLKEEADQAAERVRLEATSAARAESADAIAAHVKAATDATEKAREAEEKLGLLEQQHQSNIEKELSAQREVLEQASDAKLNAQSAKSFEETLKLTNKVNDLQRALEKKTAEELGEGAEVDVYEALKADFPEDKINRIPKGAAGADIIHVVIMNGKECGTILYDSKNHNQFRNDHVSKLRSDQIAARAEHAILSTRKFPQGTGQLHVQDGVILVNPARVVSIATIIRQHLLQIYIMRASGVEREQKTVALYEFITSEHCASLLSRVDDRASDLLELQTKEVKWHQNHWNKEGEALRAIQKAKADLTQCIGSIIGTVDAEEEELEEAS